MKKFLSSEKHPIIKSIIVTFLFLIVVSIGGAISSIAGIDSKITLFFTYLLAAVLLVLLIHGEKRWNDYGFRFTTSQEKFNGFKYIPLYVMALLPMVVGFSTDLTLADVGYILLFMALVAFVEETVFRGIILKLLQNKSDLIAILGSSLLFSIPHILNALNGKEWGQTLFQIIFALVMGMILATLMIQTNSILPLIMYHFLNNTISSITNSDIDPSVSLYVSVAVFAIGVIYLIVLSVSKRRKCSEH